MTKTVFLIGGGGREHALAWKIVQSPLVEKLVAFPGSDAIAALPKASCLPGRATDIPAAVAAAKQVNPTLVVVGPDDPLALGVVDALEAEGFTVLGPTRTAAQLESSKIFSKQFMVANEIPTAPFKVGESHEASLEILKGWDVEGRGVVIKADGLAQGKGVVVTHDRAEAEKTLHDFMLNEACTVKADRVLLEEKLSGKEVSAFALCDGETFVPLGYACDYKRVNDGDEGPNTGGMGCYTPHGWPSATSRAFIVENIFRKVVDGMRARGTPFKGFLFAGLMVDGDDVQVIEFNARMGDPETQVLIPLLQDDIVPLLDRAARGMLGGGEVAFSPAAAVHVVMTSEGYPDTMGAGMRLGQAISLPEGLNDNAHLFIAGARKKDGAWVNSGGRVLGVTALGATVAEAREKAYAALGQIHFNGAHWRTDIGI